MKKHTLTFLIIALVTGLFVPMADADNALERANLARLVGELDYLSQSVNRYKIDVTQDRRYIFDYQTLLKDISAIRKGVSEYIDNDLSLTRVLPPLKAQYIQQPIEHKLGN